MEEKTDPNPKEHVNDNNLSPLNGNGGEVSGEWTEKLGTKRQTYYICVDLIAKVRGYAYWERRGISEVVNAALEQFFEGKQVKPRPSKSTPLAKR